MPESVSLRERKKHETRHALSETALTLAVERGYGGFTIADVTDAVGVSRCTFSNYFASKGRVFWSLCSTADSTRSSVNSTIADAKKAVVGGFNAGSRVVTAAAIIMTSVFAGSILAPDAMIASIGFALGIGVLADAFLVRMTIVPAVMTLLGRRAWYIPAWLEKILPRVDIEGEALLERLRGGEHTPRHKKAAERPGDSGNHPGRHAGAHADELDPVAR